MHCVKGSLKTLNVGSVLTRLDVFRGESILSYLYLCVRDQARLTVKIHICVRCICACVSACNTVCYLEYQFKQNKCFIKMHK